MGQNYLPVNLDTQEYLSPGDWGSGAELMEHSWLENQMLCYCAQLLSPGNRWYNTRVVWAGENMDKGTFIPDKRHREENLYNYADVKFKHLQKPKVSMEICGIKYLVNKNQNQYINLKKLPPDKKGRIIHPLPLMTCSGNGKGSGAFQGQNSFTGSWAGDRLSCELIKPDKDYQEIKPNFAKIQSFKKAYVNK